LIQNAAVAAFGAVVVRRADGAEYDIGGEWPSKTVHGAISEALGEKIGPLTRAHRDDPRLAERWDLVAFGTEIGTAYSELADPVEERARLTAESLLAA